MGLKALAGDMDGPWCVMGDFNTFLHPDSVFILT